MRRFDGGAGAQGAARLSKNNWAEQGHVAPHCELGWGRGTAVPEILRSVSPMLSVHVAAYSGAADRAQSLEGWGVLSSALCPPRLYEEAGWSLRDTGDTMACCLQSLLEFTPW